MTKKFSKFSTGNQVFLPFSSEFSDEIFTVVSTRVFGESFIVNIESFDDGYIGLAVKEDDLEFIDL